MSDQISENRPLVEGTIDNSIKAELPGEPPAASTDFMVPFERALRERDSKQPKKPSQEPFLGMVSKSAQKERELLGFLYQNERDWRDAATDEERKKLKKVSSDYVDQLVNLGWAKEEIKQKMIEVRNQEAEAERMVAGFTPEPDQTAQ